MEEKTRKDVIILFSFRTFVARENRFPFTLNLVYTGYFCLFTLKLVYPDYLRELPYNSRTKVLFSLKLLHTGYLRELPHNPFLR